MSGHVFISYSRKDIEYVNRLYNWLIDKGFNVWQDVNQIEPGEQWPQGIEDALEKCGAFIVVMTPNSKQSTPVQNELLRAQRKKKQVFPLLLIGDEPWLLLESTNWEDVRAGVMPSPRFIEQLSRFAAQSDISHGPLLKEEFIKKESSQVKKRSDWRAAYSLSIILATCLVGWICGQWIGILFISMPILLIFIYVISKLAQVILPSSNSEDSQEAWQKTKVFLWYLLGIQYPFWMAQTDSEPKFDIRITGDITKKIGEPGFIWTRPHHVTALSNGSEFKIVGPGTIFTRKLETPIALIDLRKQIRVTVVNVETKDKIKIPAIVIMAFAIDRDTWPKHDWESDFTSRITNNFEYNYALDYWAGSYAFSSNRISVMLKKLGIYGAIGSNKKVFHWDKEIIKQIENTVCHVFEERYSNELWRFGNDENGGSALDEISMILLDILTPKLTEMGVKLFDIRIAGYELEQNSDTAKENIKMWISHQGQQIEMLQTEVQAIHIKGVEEAHTDVASLLTSVFTEAIERARSINPILPRYVIATYYIDMLEDRIVKQLNLEDSESRNHIEIVKDILMKYRKEGNV